MAAEVAPGPVRPDRNIGTVARGADTPSVTITPLVVSAQVTSGTLSFGSQPVSTLSRRDQCRRDEHRHRPADGLRGVTFAGAGATDFFFGSWSCGGSVAPGSSCQLAVRFAPSAPGPRAATLTIVSNDPTGPANVQLTGTGAQAPAITPASNPSPMKLGTVKLLCCPAIGAHGSASHRMAHCTKRHLSANAKFVVAAGATRGSLTRRGTVYATGVSNQGLLVLRGRRAVPAGTYTLTLAQGGHRTTTPVVVR